MSERVIAKYDPVEITGAAGKLARDGRIVVQSYTPDPEAPSVEEMCRAIDGLRGVIRTAINNGDWQVDGRCEPDGDLRQADRILDRLGFEGDD